MRYFGKELHELRIDEAAYLASLPKEPSRLQLTTARGKYFQEALARRNATIDNMARFKFISVEEAEAAKKMPLEMTNRQIGRRPSPRNISPKKCADRLSISTARTERQFELFRGGYPVRSTLDPNESWLAPPCGPAS